MSCLHIPKLERLPCGSFPSAFDFPPSPSFCCSRQGSHAGPWACLHPAACLLAGQKRRCPHVSLGKLRCACRIRFSAI